MAKIEYKVEPELTEGDLNDLFASAWKNHIQREFGPVLEKSLTYIGAFDGPKLVGFVNVAWDGGIHGFILDTTVHSEYQHQGIATEVMKKAAEVAKAEG